MDMVGRLKVLLDWIKQIQIDQINQDTFEKKIDILAYRYFLLRQNDLEASIRRHEYHKKEVGGQESEDTDDFDK
jgi:hypothetical protein